MKKINNPFPKTVTSRIRYIPQKIRMFDKRWQTEKNLRVLIKTDVDGFAFGKAETCH